MIRPAYWTDADLHTRLTAEQREFYIGLWMLADDEGYLTWDLDRVGAELYPYKTRQWRRRLAEWIEVIGRDHARVLDCGRHAVIPNLPRYQQPPRPSSQIKRQHDACMRQMVAGGTTNGHVAAGGTSTVKEVEGREGNIKGAPPRESSTSFRERLAANGYIDKEARD